MSHPTRGATRPRTLVAALLAATVLALAGCGGSGGDSLSPEDALAEAKKHLDDTSGVHFALATDDLPSGVEALKKADGTLTRAPAFKGTITVPVLGVEADVDVVAVDGKVYAKLPFTAGFQEIDPADYGVPDPATLLDPDDGISSLLDATEDVKKGDSVRGGEDNKQVLTEYAGTLPGDAVDKVLPGATGDFDATYTIDDDGELSKAVITGRFNGADHDPNTYTVTVDDYGTDEKITAP